MADEPSIFIRVDDQLDEYRPFFDHQWAAEIEQLAAGSKLAEPVFTLHVNWLAAANTCAIPWLTCHGLAQQWRSRLEGQQPLARRMTEELAERLAGEMEGEISKSKQKRLAGAIERIGQQIGAESAAPGGPQDANALWQAMLEEAEFQLAVWGSQRIAYGSIYHAYENFVRECMAIALGRPEYKAHRLNRLARDARRLFGATITRNCLLAESVTIARLVRNTLAHNAGRETENLKRLPHGLVIENGIIQILASDNRRLFDLLKRRAYRIARKAIGLPGVARQTRIDDIE